MTNDRKSKSDFIAPGFVAQANSETQYNRFGAKGGVGFAFEDANTLSDRMAGRQVDPVGVTNSAH